MDCGGSDLFVYENLGTGEFCECGLHRRITCEHGVLFIEEWEGAKKGGHGIRACSIFHRNCVTRLKNLALPLIQAPIIACGIIV